MLLAHAEVRYRVLQYFCLLHRLCFFYGGSNHRYFSSNVLLCLLDHEHNVSFLGRTIKEGAKALQFIIGETHGTAITDIAISKAKSIFGTFTPDGTDLIRPSS